MSKPSVRVAVAGWVLFSTAMFLPALVSMQVGAKTTWHVDIVGWEAAGLGLSSVGELGEDWLLNGLTSIAALMNLVMLVTPWAVFRPQGRLARALRVGMVAAILASSSCLVAWSRSSSLGMGSYCWVGSFVLVALALFMARREGCARPAADTGRYAGMRREYLADEHF